MTDNTISPPIREHGEGVREKLHKALDDDMGHLTDAQSLSGPYALRRVKETIDRALSAQPVKDSVLCGDGFVFHNPDTGEEYARNHPVTSGEVPDAENVRRSTLQEDTLHEAYQAVWAEKEVRRTAQPASQNAVREAGE